MPSIYAHRERRLGCLAAIVLGMTGMVHPNLAGAAVASREDAAGAEARVIQRAEGPVVLRGTRPAPVVAHSHGSSGNRPTWTVAPWFVPSPAAGFDNTIDREGLSPPGGIMNLDQY